MTKHSKSVVDKLLESVYSETLVTINSYEQSIVEIMMDLDCTLSEALDVDFDLNGVDTNSVLDIVDYLESKLNQNMYKVNLLMQIYTQSGYDFKLNRLT